MFPQFWKTKLSICSYMFPKANLFLEHKKLFAVVNITLIVSLLTKPAEHCLKSHIYHVIYNENGKMWICLEPVLKVAGGEMEWSELLFCYGRNETANSNGRNRTTNSNGRNGATSDLLSFKPTIAPRPSPFTCFQIRSWQARVFIVPCYEYIYVYI